MDAEKDMVGSKHGFHGTGDFLVEISSQWGCKDETWETGRVSTGKIVVQAAVELLHQLQLPKKDSVHAGTW